MRFINVGGLDVSDNRVRVRMIGEDQKSYELDMAPDVAAQLSLALSQGSTHVAEDQSEIRRGQLYTLAGCQPIAVDEQRQGILITTVEKFQFPLVMDAAAIAGLRACIAQIERGIRHGGPVH